MTLVVARVTPLGVRVAADMRITDPSATRRGFLHAALKTILLSPTRCVSYAGNVGVALDAIRRIASDDLPSEEAQSRLLDAHQRSDGGTDFLIASLRPQKLVAVKSGRVEECLAGWLGDKDAFAEYQRQYLGDHFLPPPEFYDSGERAGDIEIAIRMGNAMQVVVYGPSVVMDGETRELTRPLGGSHATVGEAIVNAVPRVEDNLFVYSLFNMAQASRFSDPLPAREGVVPPDFGSAERGAFSYFMLAPVQPGVGAIGLYFVEGRLGVLYAPLLLDAPERYPAASLEVFVELVRLRRGISLRGLAGPV